MKQLNHSLPSKARMGLFQDIPRICQRSTKKQQATNHIKLSYRKNHYHTQQVPVPKKCSLDKKQSIQQKLPHTTVISKNPTPKEQIAAQQQEAFN